MKKKEKRYGLFKGIFLFILIAIVLSWLIPNGAFGATGFQGDGTLTRVGLNDLSWLIYYGIYFAIDKIILLLAIGGLYGVLTRTNAYNRLVTGIAKKLGAHKKIVVLLFSVLLAALTSLLTQSFVVIIFVPFIISIMNRMKIDKMTILATTFGSMLVGTLGATYGTEGLVYFNQYVSSADVTITSTVLIRAGILLIGLVLFNFFTLTHMSKTENKEETADMFQIEELEDTKKRSIIPVLVIGVLLFVIVILGYVNWETNFGVTIFKDFHTMLTEEISIGKDFFIFKNILGSNMGALGTWDLFSITAIVFVFTLILALCYRVKLDDLITNFADGAKKMIKPILCVVAAFSLMVVVYMSPYVATILNKLLTLTDGFNIATKSLSAFIANIFHTDLGYTAYILATYLTSEYVDYNVCIFIWFCSILYSYKYNSRSRINKS